MTPHVPVPPELELPSEFQHVPDYLAFVDPDLRIRRSFEQPRYFVLERRCRRRPAVNTGMRIGSDIHLQARDGYMHVARVDPSFMSRPWRIVEELVEGGIDLWAAGGAQKACDELEYEEAFLKETRRRRRQNILYEIAIDAEPVLDRVGNTDGTERTRISNAGIPQG